ncbi:hypothetical protein [Microbispora sp. H11081]|uniref:hypothetical protein n=1 Tax=Microbispora sp. H11081 TaxID=2729107 RepID=UPI00147391BD|nr:hypothetical protein [Microbispora sp. H11081]
MMANTGKRVAAIHVAIYLGLYVLSFLATMYSYLGDIHPYWWQPGGEDVVDPDVALGSLIFSMVGFGFGLAAGLVLRRSWKAWVASALMLLFAIGRMIAALEAINAF